MAVPDLPDRPHLREPRLPEQLDMPGQRQTVVVAAPVRVVWWLLSVALGQQVGRRRHAGPIGSYLYRSKSHRRR
ncbi:hypothetical protein [Streptomyces sp. BRA346]|uniref:hypothetical protein n=1 Tax=Streptomyces sp. BRA346 TaxID=2878199 RepID=UPI004063FC35